MNSEIELLENEIKQTEEKLKQFKAKHKEYQKFKGLVFTEFSQYGGKNCVGGIHKERLIKIVRELAKIIVLAKRSNDTERFTISFYDCTKVKSLNVLQIKRCNDFIDDLYPILEKHVNIAIENQEVE